MDIKLMETCDFRYEDTLYVEDDDTEHSQEYIPPVLQVCRA